MPDLKFSTLIIIFTFSLLLMMIFRPFVRQDNVKYGLLIYFGKVVSLFIIIVSVYMVAFKIIPLL